jgi:hypothetical protein
MSRTLSILVAAGAFSFGAQQVNAVAIPLPPGGLTPVGAGVVPTSTELASRTDAFEISSRLKGTVTSKVYESDPAVSPLGGLIFTYQIVLDNVPDGTTPPPPLGRLTTDEDWGGFLADSSQVGPGELAITASRSSNGEILGFNFDTTGGAGSLVEGEFSALLIFGSNAQAFKDSGVNVINGGIDEVPSYAPDNVDVTVPDGGTTAILLAIGALGLAVVRPKTS